MLKRGEIMRAQISLGMIAVALIALLVGGIVGYYVKPTSAQGGCAQNSQTIDKNKVSEVIGALADYIGAATGNRPTLSVTKSYYEDGIIVVEGKDKETNRPFKAYLTPAYAFIGFQPPLTLSQLKQMTAQLKQEEEKASSVRYNVSTSDDPIEGDPNAPVTVVEFFDFQCPGCRAFYRNFHNELKDRYIDTGKVKLQFRDFPLMGHQYAKRAAIAADCALEQGEDKYFAYMDKLFNGNLDDNSLKQYAQEIGLDMDKFNTCLANETYKGEVDEDYNAAVNAGAPGTPTFFVNGRMVQYRYISRDDLMKKLYALIDEELNATNSS